MTSALFGILGEWELQLLQVSDLVQMLCSIAACLHQLIGIKLAGQKMNGLVCQQC